MSSRRGVRWRILFACLALPPRASVGVDSFREGPDRTQVLAQSSSPRIGIVTMITPNMAENSSFARAVNEQYAEQWGYGFHVFDRAIDQDRVPHWSKLHVVQIFLPEYDFVFWIDADAAFYDHSRRIEDVFGTEGHPEKHIWAQDIWPDYPILFRREFIDTGTVLFRNSRWTMQFITELYYFVECRQYLEFTEQYCFSVAHRANLFGVREKLVILQTPAINHHILPPPTNPNGMFILHLAGRPNEMRAQHFSLLRAGRQHSFTAPVYEQFWDFYRLWADHNFGGVAVQHVCLVGMGKHHLAFVDALLFHFPFVVVFALVRIGAPGLYTSLRAAERAAKEHPKRFVHMDFGEYVRGTTREGDRMPEGFYCDIFVISVDSWRHLPSMELLGALARDGFEDHSSRVENTTGFGYSGIADAYFAWNYGDCTGGAGSKSTASGLSDPIAFPGSRLDNDDDDGSALESACRLLGATRKSVEGTIKAGGRTALSEADFNDAAVVAQPVYWSLNISGPIGVIESSGESALVRVPRKYFQVKRNL